MPVLLRYSLALLLGISVGSGSLMLEIAVLSIVHRTTSPLLCETKSSSDAF
jgi:hypothetical protein